ncbi:hypothetical protein [Candidatus Clostridium stratigraminis]|uniref:Uncharacterized protein n=1 Tax=Candidatus Clostridium stratigraminis TaxID=3381661 RepID=A0ABW8T3L1_9CLOT
MELLINENDIRLLINSHNKSLALKNKMQEIRSLIFIDASREAVNEFIIKNVSKKDGNLVATLEAAVGLRQISTF